MEFVEDYNNGSCTLLSGDTAAASFGKADTRATGIGFDFTAAPTRAVGDIIPVKVQMIDQMGNPIENVHITLASDSTKGVITDQNGYADVSSFRESDLLRISHISFEPFEQVKSNLQSSETLYSADNTLDEVVITAKKKKTPWGWIALVGAALVVAVTMQEETPGMAGKPSKKKKKKAKKVQKKRVIHV